MAGGDAMDVHRDGARVFSVFHRGILRVREFRSGGFILTLVRLVWAISLMTRVFCSTHRRRI